MFSIRDYKFLPKGKKSLQSDSILLSRSQNNLILDALEKVKVFGSKDDKIEYATSNSQVSSKQTAADEYVQTVMGRTIL